MMPAKRSATFHGKIGSPEFLFSVGTDCNHLQPYYLSHSYILYTYYIYIMYVLYFFVVDIHYFTQFILFYI